MSGHSKWRQIKHKKAVSDKHKSRLFGRLAKEIAIAGRAGYDPTQNAALREAIARARKANLPQSTIDRLLATPAAATTTSTYEGFGPGGTGLLIITTTDNPNRTVAQLRGILKDCGGSLSTPGSVQWKFTPTLVWTIPLPSPADRNRLELALIEAGANDMRATDGQLVITAPPAAGTAIHHLITPWPSTRVMTYHVATAHQVALPPVVRHHLDALTQALEDHLDVDAVYTDAAA